MNNEELEQQEIFSKLSFLAGIISFFCMIFLPTIIPLVLSAVGIFASIKVKNYLNLAMNILICFTSLLFLLL